MGYQRIASPRTGRAVILRDDHWKVIEQEAERMGLSVDAAIENAIRVYQAVNHQGEGFSVAPRPGIDPQAEPIPAMRHLLTQRIP